MQRVVITGVGIYSCIGKNLEEVRDSLFYGKSGIIYSPERKLLGYRSALTGKVDRPNLKEVINRRARVTLPEHREYAYISTVEALKNASLDQDFMDKHEVGIIMGNDTCAQAVIEANDILRSKKDTSYIGSGAVFQSLNSTISMNLSTIFKLKGVNYCLSATCASGSHSIGMASILIQNVWQDCIICGGAQEVNDYSMSSFDAIWAFSTRENDPTSVSRPFDKNRDGLVPSGGGATVILESLDFAQRCGASILAEVIGYGFSSNGEHISNPSVEGPLRALNMSMKRANLKANDLDYINAHATSTISGDIKEAESIYEMLGGQPVPVSSTKSMTGHECWMAGASEIVYSILMMQNSFIAPNINFENRDESIPNLNIINRTKEKSIDIFLSNSFRFVGTNSSIVVKKFKP